MEPFDPGGTHSAAPSYQCIKTSFYTPLRGKRVVAIDPNMSDLLYCVDGDTKDQTKFRYTRRKETKAKKYRTYLQERKQEVVDGSRSPIRRMPARPQSAIRYYLLSQIIMAISSCNCSLGAMNGDGRCSKSADCLTSDITAHRRICPTTRRSSVAITVHTPIFSSMRMFSAGVLATLRALWPFSHARSRAFTHY
jgi:hypothetical protein